MPTQNQNSWNNGNAAPSGLGDVKNILAFLVAGFVGALNFLGLSSGEIGVILRNQAFGVNIIALFLLLGIVAATVSIVLPSRDFRPARPIVSVLIFFLLASSFPLMVFIIPTPSTSTLDFQRWNAAIFEAILVAVSVVIVVIVKLRQLAHKTAEKEATPLRMTTRNPEGWSRRGGAMEGLRNWQTILLLGAIILTSTATYGAMRLETRSQHAGVAQIGETLAVHGSEDSLTISISAAKLTTGEWLSVNVVGVPRLENITSDCSSQNVILWRQRYNIGPRCSQDPCYYLSTVLHKPCTELSADTIPSGPSGAVERDLSIVISPRDFQHVRITVVTCTPEITAQLAEPTLESTPSSTSTNKPSPASRHMLDPRRMNKPEPTGTEGASPTPTQTVINQPKGECVPDGASARLDLTIPAPTIN